MSIKLYGTNRMYLGYLCKGIEKNDELGIMEYDRLLVLYRTNKYILTSTEVIFKYLNLRDDEEYYGFFGGTSLFNDRSYIIIDQVKYDGEYGIHIKAMDRDGWLKYEDALNKHLKKRMRIKENNIIPFPGGRK